MVVSPTEVVFVESIHGKRALSQMTIRYHPNIVSDLEEKYIFEDGQAELAKRELNDKSAFCGVVRIRR